MTMCFGVSCCLGKHLVLLLYKGQRDKRIKGGDFGGFMSLTVAVKL